jgi:pimeloyl-ACP methyl ester carboxylesterase
VLVSPAPPRGIPLLTRRLIVAMIPYLGAMLRSRPFVPRWRDLRRLVLTRVPDSEQGTLVDQFVPDSGRAARELALGAVAVDRARVRCPMLVVGGDADQFIPLPVVRRVAARYGAPLHVAHDHAHLLPLEPGWETTATFIADWIAAHAPAPKPEVIA